MMMIKRPAPVRWQRRPAKRADACTVIYQSRRREKGGRVKLVSKLDSKKHWLPVVLEPFQEQCCGEITLKLLCFFVLEFLAGDDLCAWVGKIAAKFKTIDFVISHTGSFSRAQFFR